MTFSDLPESIRRPLTISEVAAVAGVEGELVSGLLDKGILPSSSVVAPAGATNRGRPLLKPEACALVIAHAALCGTATPETRSRVFQAICTMLEGDIDACALTAGSPHFNVTGFVQSAFEGLAALAKAEANVSSDPDVRGGATVVRGTRITVHEAADLAKGETLETILAEFPTLTAESIEDAIRYAKANPADGRQRENSRRHRNMRLVSSTRVTLKEL